MAGKIIPLMKRWFNILTGKTTAAVDQKVGRCFSTTEVKGYYNDLTQKVTSNTLLDEDGIPYNIASSGEKVYLLVSVFQYALGCYDLFLLTGEEEYKNSFLKLAEYVASKQEDSGKWDARASFGSSRENQSCMAQAQGCSVLLRAYLLNRDSRFISLAQKGIDFMLIPCEKGGTALYRDDDIYLEKYPVENGVHSAVLNGWIFGLFGLFDFVLYSNDSKYLDIYKRSCETLKKTMPMYDRKYWSNYDLIDTIASPAYHTTHIALLEALSEISGESDFKKYAEVFEKYNRSRIKKLRAVIVKAKQKLTKPSDAFIVQ